MRLLLIAYEFPPSPSPQSLRWIYLVRELVQLGHEVHVLAPELGGETRGLPAIPSDVIFHRTFPGPVRGLLAFFRRRRHRKINADLATTAIESPRGDEALGDAIRPPRNWRQRISEQIQEFAQFVHFPDIRGEWRPWASRRLPRLLDTIKPEAVISSHEPATTIELALLAKRRGFFWVADLGDPVLASYTPSRWIRRASRIEHAMCNEADLITVTTEATAALMQKRHGRTSGFVVIPQGHDAQRPTRAPAVKLFDDARLELFYTGSFYQFRRPDALLAAILKIPNARLTIASIAVPESVLAASRRSPSQIRLLGFRPHNTILDLQKAADVLINIANDDMTQIPGKVNEYFGSGRPVLNLGPGDDTVSAELTRLRRGWNCRNEINHIVECLTALNAAKSENRLDELLDLSHASVSSTSWRAIATRLDNALRQAVKDGSASD